MNRYRFEWNGMMESCMMIEDLLIDGKTASTTVESIQLLQQAMRSSLSGWRWDVEEEVSFSTASYMQ